LLVGAMVAEEPVEEPPQQLERCQSTGSVASGSECGSDGLSPKDEGGTPVTRRLSDDPVVLSTRLVISAVQAICDAAAEEEKPDPAAVRFLCGNALHMAEEAHRTAREHRVRRKARQAFQEFATILGDEVVEAAEEMQQEAGRKLRKARSLIEDHFAIDEAFRMLGPLAQDANFARDVHDWFNLVALVPVILLNFLNFSCDDLFFCGIPSGKATLQTLWTGQLWEAFWWTTFAYFSVDLLFVVSLPKCVRSPGVIIYHHMATILYIMVPKRHPKLCWLMGCCMVVEVNTWFLIARRSFNKRGDKPFAPGVAMGKSLRLATVSTCFYISWFAIRIIFYPYLLTEIFIVAYDHWVLIGTLVNLVSLTPIIQFILMCMNFKWTFDLIRSKLKGRDKKSKASKGL